LYPEVVDDLGETAAGFSSSPLSQIFDGRLRFILGHLGISKYLRTFSFRVNSTDKPDPEIFRRAVKLIDLKPNQVLHVGDDSERDWKAAAAAGCLCLSWIDKEFLRGLLKFL